VIPGFRLPRFAHQPSDAWRSTNETAPDIATHARATGYQRQPAALPATLRHIAPAPPGRTTPTLRVPDAALMFRTLTAWNEAISLKDAQKIGELTQQSNAGQFASLRPLIEDGDPDINRTLRTHRQRTRALQRFLSDFGQLRDYRGESYRAAWLKPAALDALLHRTHTRFFDDGIQTASVALPHAQIWLRHLRDAQRDLRPAILIFDPSVPQKNLSHGNGLGMVAVEPGASLELRRVVQHQGITFALFSTAEDADGVLTKLPDGSLVYRSAV
jgi:hypothetical protein